MIDIVDLLGVRYKKGGRDLKGLDCYGLAIIVEKRFGHTLPDSDDFKNREQDFALHAPVVLEKLKSKIKEVSYPVNEGDIILFNNGKVLAHIGIYLGNSRFIHCDKFGVHIERLEFRFDIGRCYTWLQ